MTDIKSTPAVDDSSDVISPSGALTRSVDDEIRLERAKTSNKVIIIVALSLAVLAVLMASVSIFIHIYTATPYSDETLFKVIEALMHVIVSTLGSQ